jgi:hypothetical protein
MGKPEPHEPKSFVSIKVTIVNETGYRFVRANFETSSGTYTVEPAYYIADGDSCSFYIESCGVMTGAIGTCAYKMEQHGGLCQFDYSAPFIGGNKYSYSSPKGYIVQRVGSGTGWRTEVAFHVRPA